MLLQTFTIKGLPKSFVHLQDRVINKHDLNSFLFPGNSNSNDGSPCSDSNLIQQHIPSQWHMSPPHQIRNLSPANSNQTLSNGLSQLTPQPITQSLGGFPQNSMQHGIHSYHPQAAKSFGHQPFYGWY